MSNDLCVDLDGTLLQTDCLHEALLRFLKPNPARLFFVLAWLCRGQAYLKRRLAAIIDLDPQTLPFHHPFLNWLREQKTPLRHRPIIKQYVEIIFYFC